MAFNSKESVTDFSVDGCGGLAAVCDCGIPWTFLLTFFLFTLHVKFF